jgi:hypothetical protein
VQHLPTLLSIPEILRLGRPKPRCAFFADGGTSAEIIRLDPQVSLATSLRGRFAPATFSGSGLLTLLTDCSLPVIPQLSDLPAADFNAVMENLRPLAASRHFLLILDPPSSATSVSAVTSWDAAMPQDLEFVQLTYPRLLVERSLLLTGSPAGPQIAMGGSGAVAAVTSCMDQQQGLWKTPAVSVLSLPALKSA